ncbi:hypothetical protein F5Y01DRAFT_310083 [Xylaria sp. FL0043]|nr:hypothetical protein F5Y01DRAFT_310083 [Xylaria sp. FL0043]
MSNDQAEPQTSPHPTPPPSLPCREIDDRARSEPKQISDVLRNFARIWGLSNKVHQVGKSNSGSINGRENEIIQDSSSIPEYTVVAVAAVAIAVVAGTLTSWLLRR